MPSLENSEDVYGNNIHSLGLHEFVLSDNARVFIPLAQCLYQASVSDEGQLRQIVAIDGRYPELTPSEIERVSHHSKQASEIYQAVIAYNQQRLLGDDIGAKLSQLAKALRSGGAHGSGSELNAGSEANLGLLAFGEYWDALSERQKITIFTETPELKDVLGRLFRPDDVNYKETRFCVELLAQALDPIIQRYNKKPTIQTLHDRVLKQENAFRAAAQNRHGLEIIPKAIPPKHILHRIFELNIDEQKVLFKQQGYENALMYALAHAPEALIEFELDEKSKQYAISVQVNANNDSALIVAAQKGETNAIELLLSWGAQIESHDLNNSTALHWAANNGHVDAVNCLLEHGALLDARAYDNRTPLIYAVKYGHKDLVKLLLKNNADINARSNAEGVNALDIAIAIQPKLIEPILMQLATLPADKQAECLLNVPGGPYDDVYAYVAVEKPQFFNSLILNSLKASNAGTADLTAILTQMHFDEHIEHIYTHYQRMKKKSLSNSNYIDAASAAKTLLIECGKAKVALFQSDAVTDIKILSFKNTCKSVIETAKPVLEKHREGGKVLAAFLLAIITIPVSLPLYATGFFSVKTKSEQLLDKLHKAIDKPISRGG
jgi:hypothetical protein